MAKGLGWLHDTEAQAILRWAWFPVTVGKDASWSEAVSGVARRRSAEEVTILERQMVRLQAIAKKGKVGRGTTDSLITDVLTSHDLNDEQRVRRIDQALDSWERQ